MANSNNPLGIRAMIEELIVSAISEARNRAKEPVQQEMMKLTGGLNLPGVDGLLG